MRSADIAMNQVFDNYARYYDLLYRDKDYDAEAGYVARLLGAHLPSGARILELGCGTGAHAERLAKLGFIVHGVDLSPEMLARAEARKTALTSELAGRLSFSQGDARTVRTGDTYDAVISLFHVLSYQTSNADVTAAFETAFAHLRSGGVFLFDFWYGPAVLTQRPETRVKRMEDEAIRVTRIAEPVLHTDRNVVDVNYSVFVQDKSNDAIALLHELHPMRYFSLPELTCYHEGAWRELRSEEWMTGGPLSMDSWSATQLLQRI